MTETVYGDIVLDFDLVVAEVTINRADEFSAFDFDTLLLANPDLLRVNDDETITILDWLVYKIIDRDEKGVFVELVEVLDDFMDGVV